jgi:hypothetical protein
VSRTKKQQTIVDGALKSFSQVSTMRDEETLHVIADKVLVESLRELGFPEIAEAYEKLEGRFYYA